MSLDFNKVYVFDNSLEILKKEDNYLYIDYENVNWLRTDSTGNELISQMDGEKTLDEIIQATAEKYGFPKSILVSKLSPYIETIIDKEIVIEKGKEHKVLHGDEFSAPISSYWIHVSGRCNLACDFCYSNSHSNNSQHLKVEEVLEYFGKLPEEERTNIIISGGEPFLYKNLPELVAGLREQKFKDIQVISNGTVGEEIYDAVLPQIDTLQISVDGSIAEIHDKSRGKGTYNKMIEKFKMAREKGAKHIVISFTPTKYNIEDLPNIAQFALDNNIDGIHLTRLMPVGRGKDSESSIHCDENTYSQALRQFLINLDNINQEITFSKQIGNTTSNNKNNRNAIGLSFAGDQSKKVVFRFKRTTCGIGGGSVSLNYDGNVYPCPSLQYDEYKLGSIKDNDILHINNGAREFGKKYGVDSIPGCLECKWRYFCGGGCRACALGAENDICGKDPMCEQIQDSLVEIMWNYRM